jgi:hypothetical protein
MDQATHKRFLEYRERFVYFGRGEDKHQLTRDEFLPLDAEQITLEALGDRRTDEEEARYAELSRILFRD